MTWAGAVESIVWAIVFLGIILALVTNFWETLASGRRRDDDE
jgi:hypothetical protein